jgi:excinuclease ABC subunit B
MTQNALFRLSSPFTPSGDQPAAIAALTAGLDAGQQNQVLLGVTGSGKTFSIAHTLAAVQRPALIMAHNKTLAAQLYTEMKDFFPDNAVEYFVSYYDYYQPEAYVPRTNTYIEKDSAINEQIDRMRHAATRALLERRDTIIVASVSCLYGLGSAENYETMVIDIIAGQRVALPDFFRRLTEIQYKRNDIAFARGCFRVRGDVVDIFPSHYEDHAWRLSFFGDELESIQEFQVLTGQTTQTLTGIRIFANSHHVTPAPTLRQATHQIKADLQKRIIEFEDEQKWIEAQRIRERTTFDLEMLETTGMCKGIENYSRYLSGKKPGEPPPTLFEYLPRDAVLIVDESHVTVPQIHAMYRGDQVRKTTLSDYGFRLPSCKDNRPLKFEEWDTLRPQTIFVSATPSEWELDQAQGVFVEQVVRPTGLVDPVILIRPTTHQVDDVIAECRTCAAQDQRVLITTLTKKMAEDLTGYLNELGLKCRYVHADVDTLERIEILRDLRLGVFDILIGINLLREGLDIPECALVAILDADKEGFLRSRTSLIQTIGRAARNVEGRAILYADRMTKSMTEAIDECTRRREKQLAYNAEHGITPQSIVKKIAESLYDAPAPTKTKGKATPSLILSDQERIALKIDLEKQMRLAAENLDFERAGELRDRIRGLG